MLSHIGCRLTRTPTTSQPAAILIEITRSLRGVAATSTTTTAATNSSSNTKNSQIVDSHGREDGNYGNNEKYESASNLNYVDEDQKMPDVSALDGMSSLSGTSVIHRQRITSPSTSTSAASTRLSNTSISGWRRHLTRDVEFVEPDVDVRLMDQSSRRPTQMDFATKPKPPPTKATKQDLDRLTTPLQSSTLAPYVNQMPVLQKLVDIGVDLFKIDRMKHQEIAKFIITRNWKRDVEPIIKTLVQDVDLPVNTLGDYITRNPWILQQKVAHIRDHVTYLKSKAFSESAIATVCLASRYWLNLDVKTIDARLGWLQQRFELNGDQVRHVITIQPLLLANGTGFLERQLFVLQEECGFTQEQIRQMLVDHPDTLLANSKRLTESFTYLHRTLDQSHEQIAKFPVCLNVTAHHLRERHQFLHSIGRSQLDSAKPNYVPLDALAMKDDQQFCELVAKCPVSAYNRFVKTM